MSNVNKNGIGKIIGSILFPCELRIYRAGMDKSNGINSLMIPIKINRILLYLLIISKIISRRKNNRKKQYEK